MAHGRLSVEIVFLKLLLFPIARYKHFRCDLCFQFHFFNIEIWTFSYLVCFVIFNIEMLPLFVVIDLLLFMGVRIRIIDKFIELLLIYVHWICCYPFKLITVLLDPLLFHGFSESDLSNLLSNATFHLSHF
jgi:hypothetical protein